MRSEGIKWHALPESNKRTVIPERSTLGDDRRLLIVRVVKKRNYRSESERSRADQIKKED